MGILPRNSHDPGLRSLAHVVQGGKSGVSVAFFLTSANLIKMDSAIDDLFQFTRSRVTEKDIADFSPNDPGYPDYVRLWTQVHRTGIIPRQIEFDLSEVIALTGWGVPSAYFNPEGFRNFRRFTSSVGVTLLHFFCSLTFHGNTSVFAGRSRSNYMARWSMSATAQKGQHAESL